MNYQQMNNYAPYQPMPQPYPDRLAQLQNQYQQAVNVPQIQAPVQNQQVNQGLLWVQGEAGAKSYLVAPSTTVLLMDSEGQRFYLKSTDGAGMPSLRVFEYTEITNVPQNTTQAPNLDENVLNGKYVTREEYEGLKRQYESIMDRLDSFTEKEVSAKPSRTKAKGGNSDAESDI